MKKFIKYGFIIGCILILVGVGIATVSFSLGGNPYHLLDDMQTRFEGYAEKYTGYEMTAESAENALAELVMETLSDVEISIEDGEVIVYTEPGLEDAVLACGNGSWDHVSYRNMGNFQKLRILAKDGEQYTLILPETWKLSDFNVECVGGYFDGVNIRADETEFLVCGGHISVAQGSGDDVKLECTGGLIDWNADGYLPAQMDAECAGGEINMNIGAEIDLEKIGYEIECTGGSIDFFGTSFEGMSYNRRDPKDGMPYFDLEIVGGSITVQ